MSRKPKPPRNPRRTLAHGAGYCTVTGPTKVQARWREGTKWRAKTFNGHTLDEAHERAEAHVRAETSHVLDPDTHDYTVTDIIEAWLKRGETRWASATAYQYREQYAKHIKESLGQLRARDITTARIQYWVDELVGQELKPATVRLIYVVLAGGFKEAARLEIVRVNPARGIALPTIRRKSRITWSVEDVQRVFADVASDPYWHAVYRLALTTAIRPGELIALRWAQVDLEQGHVTIARTLSRETDGTYTLADQTKTKSPRVVAVPASTVSALRAWRREQNTIRLASAYWFDDDLVFASIYGHPLDRNVWYRFQQQLCIRAKVPPIAPHGMRHTLATILMASREHPAIVQHILGHRSIKTTLDEYTHPGIDLQEQALSALDAQFNGTKTVKK